MFIKTKEKRLFNSEHIHYFEVTPYLNVDKANLDAYLAEGHFVLFSGTLSETNAAFYFLMDDLAKGDKKLFDFDYYFSEESDDD